MIGIKNTLRSITSNAIAIVAASYIVEGFHVAKDPYTIAIGAFVLGLVNIFLKPIIKLISFPINIITMGFFNWIINAGLIYITVYLVDGFSLTAGTFGLDLMGITIPVVQLSAFWTLIATTVVISIVNWILKIILL